MVITYIHEYIPFKFLFLSISNIIKIFILGSENPQGSDVETVKIKQNNGTVILLDPSPGD